LLIENGVVEGTFEQRLKCVEEAAGETQAQVNDLLMRTCALEMAVKKKAVKKKAVKPMCDLLSSSSSSSSSSLAAAEAEKAAAEAAAKNAEKALAPPTAKTLMRTRSHP
jgi:hypothetical protein